MNCVVSIMNHFTIIVGKMKNLTRSAKNFNFNKRSANSYLIIDLRKIFPRMLKYSKLILSQTESPSEIEKSPNPDTFKKKNPNLLTCIWTTRSSINSRYLYPDDLMFSFSTLLPKKLKISPKPNHWPITLEIEKIFSSRSNSFSLDVRKHNKWHVKNVKYLRDTEEL